MSRMTTLPKLILVLALSAVTSLAVAFPFWLGSPSRSNPYDPKCTGSGCYTPTPVFTPTPKGTLTDTPTLTDSPTLTVTPVVTSAVTPLSPVLLQEFTSGGANDDWNEPIVNGSDYTDGSTQVPGSGASNSPWTAGDQTCGAGDTGPNPEPGLPATTCSACVHGTMVAALDPPYAFAYLAMDLTPGGEADGSGTGVGISLAELNATSPNQGVMFDYEGTPGITYWVQFVTDNISCTQYWFASFTAAAANTWYHDVVYFPTVTTSATIFAAPSYGCTATTLAADWNNAGENFGAIQFSVAPTSSSQTYSLCVDNVRFDVPVAPTPAPTAAITLGPVLLQEFTNGGADDDWNEPIVNGSDYTDGSTQIPGTGASNSPWTTGDQTCGAGDTGPNPEPGLPATTCSACVHGTMVAALDPPYAFAYLAMDLTPGGEADGTGTGVGISLAQLESASPNSGVMFDYEGTPGVTYWVQLVTDNVACTQYWYQSFTAAAANTWYHKVVYFPNLSTTSLQFIAPSYGCSPATSVGNTWSNAGEHFGAIQFSVAPSAASQTYSLCVDNVRFDVPPAVIVTPTSTPPPIPPIDSAYTLIADFEEPSGTGVGNLNDCMNAAISVGPPGGSATWTGPASCDPWVSTSGAVPATTPIMLPNQTPNPSTLSFEITGNVPGPSGSWMVATFLFIPGGWGSASGGGPVYGSCPAGIEAIAPNKRLVFSYMVGPTNIDTASVLTPIAVQLISQDPAQAGYQFWNYWVWPTASNTWAQAIIYFPDSPYANAGSGQSYFVNSGCGGCSWTPCTVSGLEIGPGAPTANNGYDIWVDNIAFD